MNALFQRSAKLTWTIVLPLVGLPDDMEVKSRADFDRVYRHYKTAMIVARNNNDEERCRVLSNVRKFIERKRKSTPMPCLTCGAMASGDYCGVHRRDGRKKKALPEPEVSGDVMIPNNHVKRHEISRKLQMLRQVGDSCVLTGEADETIYSTARRLGIQIILRCLTQKPAHALSQPDRAFRVWRSDGKTLSEINAIIAQRREANLKTA